MTRTLCFALAFTLPLAVCAQDKPAAPAADRPANGDTYKTWEDRLHTTDCSKMPSRMVQSDCEQAHFETREIVLHNVTQQNDANEILVAVRNLAPPSIKVYLLASTETIVVGTYPQELDRIEALVRKLDVPRKTFRITYTVITTEGGKRIGVEHYSMLAADGQAASSKQGSKVPVATGSYSATGNNNGSQTQFTYLDVGMNFNVTPSANAEGVAMKTKIEQSSVGDTQTIAGVAEPVIRQAVYEGVVIVPMGKSVALGSLDLSGSNRHIDIEVMAEPLQ